MILGKTGNSLDFDYFGPESGLKVILFEFSDQIWNPVIKTLLIVLFLKVWQKVIFLASKWLN